jgi:hypothetical protein
MIGKAGSGKMIGNRDEALDQDVEKGDLAATLDPS